MTYRKYFYKVSYTCSGSLSTATILTSNLKIEIIVVQYVSSSNDLDIEHFIMKVKVIIGFLRFSPFTTMKTIESVTQDWNGKVCVFVQIEGLHSLVSMFFLKRTEPKTYSLHSEVPLNVMVNCEVV